MKMTLNKVNTRKNDSHKHEHDTWEDESAQKGDSWRNSLKSQYDHKQSENC